MGLLADYLNRRALADRNAASAAALPGLLGMAPNVGGELGAGDVGPPAPAGSGGQGLLGSPSLAPAQRDQITFAGGLLADPGLRPTGSTLLRGVFSDAAAGARQGAANQTTLDVAEARLRQDEDQFRRTLQQRTDIANDKAAAARFSGARAAPEPGMERLFDADGTIAGDRMIAGGTPYRNAEKAAIGTRDTLGLVDKVVRQIGGADGFESFGRVKGEMASIFNQLIARRLKTREFGAPQAGEFEFLESELLNFSKLGARAGFAKKGEALGQLQAYRDELQRSFDSQRAQSGFGTGIDSDIPGLRDELAPAPFSFDEAAALGLTPASRTEIEGRSAAGADEAERRRRASRSRLVQ